MVPFLKGAIHRHDAVNKPMALTFTDAVTGAPVDISTMKGKVIMLDFWATWCGPCIAELPTVKKLYETYHDKGLEVIGISLDVPEAQGGLTKLKDFVAKNSMPWPEYFEGKQFGGDFSGAYGIMSIPAQFLIDKNGMFVGMADVRSAEFEAELQKLLNASS